MSVPAVPPRPLRVLPAPVSEPQALIRLRPRAVARPRLYVQETLPLRLTDGPLGDGPSAADADFDRRPTASTELPDPDPLAAALVRAVIEVLGGSRPVAQLLRWLSSDVYAGLQRRAALAARVRSTGRSGPVARTTTHRVHVRRVLIDIRRNGIAEAAVVVADGDRVRAVGLRMEGLDGRWRVTALEVG